VVDGRVQHSDVEMMGEVDENTGLTPLLIACMAGSTESLSVLLEPCDNNDNDNIRVAIKKALATCDAKMRTPVYHACKGKFKKKTCFCSYLC
jgi:hypothetical protein